MSGSHQSSGKVNEVGHNAMSSLTEASSTFIHAGSNAVHGGIHLAESAGSALVQAGSTAVHGGLHLAGSGVHFVGETVGGTATMASEVASSSAKSVASIPSAIQGVASHPLVEGASTNVLERLGVKERRIERCLTKNLPMDSIADRLFERKAQEDSERWFPLSGYSIIPFRGGLAVPQRAASTAASTTSHSSIEMSERTSQDPESSGQALARAPSWTVTGRRAAQIFGVDMLLKQSESGDMDRTLTYTNSVQGLLELGASMDQVCVEIYDVMRVDRRAANLFENLNLEKSGGLDSVHRIWYKEKFLWSACLFIFVVFNVVSLLLIDCPIFTKFLSLVMGEAPEINRDAEAYISGKHARLEHMQHTMLTELGSAEGESADLFAQVPVKTRNLLLVTAAFIATCEVSWLVYTSLAIIYYSLRFAFSQAEDGKSEYIAYSGLYHVFVYALPTMSTFSALKLLFHVHPAFLYSFWELRVQSFIQTSRTKAGVIFITCSFVLERLLYLAIAMLAFFVKVISVSFKCINASYSWTSSLMALGALLNQCIGCVQVERVLQDRVFLFVFGGTDADLQADEHALLRVYRARLMRAIWKHYWEGGEKMKALAILSSLDHYDLQGLLIHEDLKPRDLSRRLSPRLAKSD